MQTDVERDAGAVSIAANGIMLEGNLLVPKNPRGVAVFAHGSGSSRFSSRNRHVAHVLREGGLATLLLDLLTPEEEEIDMRTSRIRFDIDLLAERLVGAVEWLREQPEPGRLPVGFFGASTGGGAALVAAAEMRHQIAAVVSRGGRPDLAGPALPLVAAPTLLIVGGADLPVIAMNREAHAQLRCEKALEIVPGATHLFEEPGTLDSVAELARDWFLLHFAVTGD